ncbi:hypothetical protein M2311_004171 [Rhizobium leguminosarum]|nr:hypothetical protein [Rhizobium leguminosarum]MDH6274071.1 hypothetical protein [Rhizobium leguminosarum]
MVDRELAHRGRDEGGRRGGLGGDPQVAGDDVLQLGNIGFGFLDDGEYPVGMQDEPLAGRCQHHPSPAPLDERDSRFVLQLGDLLRNGR